MSIPTEPIGSIPRPRDLIDAIGAHAAGEVGDDRLQELFEEALADTIARFEETGSPVISDGEQTKSSFVTYPFTGQTNLAPGGVIIGFADGHTRQLPLLAAGPFGYGAHAVDYLEAAQAQASVPVKQAVIAASALSLIYPEDGVEGYPREAFIQDLVQEAAADIQGCLDAGAPVVQIDFTEGRLACKLDPSLGVLRAFVDLNNQVLAGFSDADRARIGVHTCPGGDFDSTHSADVDYAELLPDLFRIEAGNFYIELAGESDRPRVLELIARHSRPEQRIFVGVTDPIDPKIETAEEVRDRVLEAAEFIPLDRLGTTDDCGFAPFADDTSTARDTAFAKIKARVEGTAMAAIQLGV